MKNLLTTAAAFALGITAVFAQSPTPGVTKTSSTRSCPRHAKRSV